METVVFRSLDRRLVTFLTIIFWKKVVCNKIHKNITSNKIASRNFRNILYAFFRKYYLGQK